MSRFNAAPIPLNGKTPDLAAAVDREFRKLSSQLWDGLPTFNQTNAEHSASVIPTNYAYPPGSFLRYGMDPTGVKDCAVAFQNACKCNCYVFDDYPGGGTYKFSSQANISNYPLRVSGSQMGQLGTATGPGTVFVASASLGIGGICVNFTSFSDVEVERIKFQLKASAGTLSLVGMAFAELRNSTIEKCSFFGPGTTSDDTMGVVFNGTGTFTGGVSVDKCYFSNHKYGINIQGSVTDLRVINSTIYGTPGHASSHGIHIGSTNCNGLMIIGNSFNLWHRGIYSMGAGIKQIGNRFEDSNPQWEWVVGTATSHQSIGDTIIGGGVPIWSQADADANIVFSAAGYFGAGATIQANRGFQEGGGAGTALRSFAMGYPQTVTFAAGNFTGNGSMTWTVASGGQASFWYSIVGKTLTVNFSISGTVGGTPNTALQIAIPGGFTAASFSLNSLSVFNGGAWAVGACQVAAAASVIQIFNTPAGSVNWTAGTASVVGQIHIQVG